MAKYTELLSEYLENGGELPAIFAQIPDFKEAFIGKYCDCEIGFETPVLFQIKLETRANVIIPAYAKRIAEYIKAEEILSNPQKFRTKTGEITRTYGEKYITDTNTKAGNKVNSGTDKTTFDNSQKMQTEADYPYINGTTPSITKQTTDSPFKDTQTLEHSNTETYNGYEDKVSRIEKSHTDSETYNDLKDIESGYTASEAFNLFKALEDKVFILIDECLKEFDNLFMKVY